MRLDRALLAFACALCCLALLPARAAADWETFDAGTQALLAPWQDGWSRLPTDERERLLANARHWQAMDAGARAALIKRDAQWQALPPAERARLRARYAAWKELPVEEQSRVRVAASRFESLPVPQQGAIRASFATQGTDRQLDWLLGPSIGEWIDQAGDWFAFVPDGEREATLRMLQALPTDTRTQLFTLARHLPPDRREQLRKDLLLVAPAQRAALIGERLAR